MKPRWPMPSRRWDPVTGPSGRRPHSWPASPPLGLTSQWKPAGIWGPRFDQTIPCSPVAPWLSLVSWKEPKATDLRPPDPSKVPRPNSRGKNRARPSCWRPKTINRWGVRRRHAAASTGQPPALAGPRPRLDADSNRRDTPFSSAALPSVTTRLDTPPRSGPRSNAPDSARFESDLNLATGKCRPAPSQTGPPQDDRSDDLAVAMPWSSPSEVRPNSGKRLCSPIKPRIEPPKWNRHGLYAEDRERTEP